MFHAGKHLILDCITYDHDYLINYEKVENILTIILNEIGANILHIKFHSFGLNLGYTGLFLLSESHLSIHTWPEKDFFSMDIYTCGDVDSRKSLDMLKKYINISHYNYRFLERKIQI